LEREDFDDPQKLEKLARAASSEDSRLAPEAFNKHFEPIVTQLCGGF